MGQRRHGKSRGLKFFLWKRKRKSSIGNRNFVHHRKRSPAKGVELGCVHTNRVESSPVTRVLPSQ